LAEITIPVRSHDEAILVLGPYDRYAKLLRQALDIELYNRAGNLRLKGGEDDVREAERRIEHLLGKSRKGRELSVRDIESILLDEKKSRPARQVPPPASSSSSAHTTHRPGRHPSGAPPHATPRFMVRPVEPRTENQRRYLELIEERSLVFGSGAAGTGKTFLAVVAAMRMLRQGVVRRLVITRPVVEAGEHLGFLPGDVQAKLNPYMRPIYDALFELIDPDDLARLEEANIIEVAPLAYMRGRTLSSAFVILDEGQNTTIGQMKMFLTRLGEGSRMIVTGDPSQNDLPAHTRSGLVDVLHRLRGYEDVGFIDFGPQDVVRHPLVAQVVKAYQRPSRRDDELGDARTEDS